MQPRGWRCHRSWFGGEHRLITFRIFRLRFPMDIRWQRHLAYPSKINLFIELDYSFSGRFNSENSAGNKSIGELSAISKPMPRSNQAPPRLRIDLFQQQELGLSLAESNPSRNHLCVIKY